MHNRTMGATEWTLLAILSLLWGGSFFFVEVALGELGPLSVVLGRVGIAAMVLLAVVHFGGKRMPTELGIWAAFLVMGGLNNLIPFTLITWGQTHIESGLASILNATTPLFTVVLAHVLTADERMTPNRVMGVLLGLGGVAVLMGPDGVQGFDIQGMGQVAVLGAALSYALAGLYGRRFREMAPSVAAAGMLTTTTVVMVPVVMVFEPHAGAWPGATVWGALLGLAVLSTALAYLIYFRLLATAGATNLLLVTFLIPVSALALGIGVLGEEPTWTAFAGMALVFLGLAAVDGRLLKRLPKAVTPLQP